MGHSGRLVGSSDIIFLDFAHITCWDIISSMVGSSSQRNSPFREIFDHATEQVSSSSICNSPDDASYDGIKSEETETWQLQLAYTTTWPGMVHAICP